MIYHDGRNADEGTDLHGLEDAVAKTVRALREHEGEFDSIVCTGLSGVIVAVPASLELGIPCVIIRKPNDDSHLPYHVNMAEAGARYCFVDDFVSGGHTRARVMSVMEQNESEYAGSYLYRDDEWDRP